MESRGETPVPLSAGVQPISELQLQKDAQPRAQFVVLYRRGIPWNAKRAAWWLNDDLLCGTGMVLPCFMFSIRNLQLTYQGRNAAMGARPGVTDHDAVCALRSVLAKRGPLPEIGMRAGLWERDGD